MPVEIQINYFYNSDMKLKEEKQFSHPPGKREDKRKRKPEIFGFSIESEYILDI